MIDNEGNYWTTNYIEGKENGLRRIFFASGNIRESVYENDVLQTKIVYLNGFTRCEYKVTNGV